MGYCDFNMPDENYNFNVICCCIKALNEHYNADVEHTPNIDMECKIVCSALITHIETQYEDTGKASSDYYPPIKALIDEFRIKRLNKSVLSNTPADRHKFVLTKILLDKHRFLIPAVVSCTPIEDANKEALREKYNERCLSGKFDFGGVQADLQIWEDYKNSGVANINLPNSL
ncbi:hypothetical protein FACS1894105_09850 [Clostridia bacterium]|nr:hypothetical protein FACS1894105_09850 [Clostridia bacterium]